MEVYLPEAHAPAVIAAAEAFGVAAQMIGRVEAASHKQLTIRSAHGTFHYS